MVRAADIVADRLGRVRADEDRAGVAEDEREVDVTARGDLERRGVGADVEISYVYDTGSIACRAAGGSARAI